MARRTYLPAAVPTIRGLFWHLDREDIGSVDRDHGHLAGDRRFGPVCDKRLQTEGVGTATLMTRAGTCYPAIVLDADEQDTARSVGETDDRFDQVVVGKLPAIALELGVVVLAGSQPRPDMSARSTGSSLTTETSRLNQILYN
jgi:hypothetical protein